MRVVADEVDGHSVPLQEPSLEDLHHAGDVASHPIPLVPILVDLENDHLPALDDDEVGPCKGAPGAAEAHVVLPLEVDAGTLQDLGDAFLLLLAMLLTLSRVVVVMVRVAVTAGPKSGLAVGSEALVRQLTRVNACVSYEGRLFCKAGSTSLVGARVWLRSCVGVLMIKKITSRGKGRPTFRSGALVRSDLQTGAFVSQQLGVAPESSPAIPIIAAVWPRFGMNELVVPEIVPMFEGALAPRKSAGKRPGSRVRDAVLLQLPLSWKRRLALWLSALEPFGCQRRGSVSHPVVSWRFIIPLRSSAPTGCRPLR